MRRALLLAACALAAFGIFLPTVSHAEKIPFPYYGGFAGQRIPLLPCTGFAVSPAGPGTPEQAVVDPGTIGYTDSTNSQVLPRCTSICDLFVFANRLLWFVISVMVTIIAPLFFFVGGIMIFISGGNPGKRESAMKIIQGTGVGLLILLCSSLIVNQMLFLIFNQQWGDALKARVENSPELGFTKEEVENMFTWNNIACSVNASGVQLTPYDPKLQAPQTQQQPTTQTNGARNCLGSGGTCVNLSAQNDPRNTQGLRCAGSITTDTCSNTSFPNCCMPSSSHACAATCGNAGWSGVVDRNGGCICRRS